MTGVGGDSMTSVPPRSHSSLASSEEVDRIRTGSAWRKEIGDRSRGNTESIVMNGIRSNSDDQDCSRTTMDRKGGRHHNDSDNHIVSVHNNPFFKTYGIRTQRPDSRGEEQSGREGSVTLRSVNNKENDCVFDEEEPQEYRPGSGFVHKLMGKFSSLTTREHDSNYRPKRTSSLENLLDDQPKRDSSIKEDVPRRISGSLSKSVENVNNIGKPLRPLKVPASSYRSNTDSSDKKVVKSPREGSEAPFLARDDIIIIEKEPMDRPEPKSTQLPDSPGKFSGPQVISLKDEPTNIDELPKPNTVLSVRSMFEKSAPSAPMPIYSTATGPVVLSPTTNLKAPAFSQKAVSKVTPSVSTESAQSHLSNQAEPTEKPKKRMAPKPPIQNRQVSEQKTNLPMPKPRSKQSPVIAVAPFVNDINSNDHETDGPDKSNNIEKVAGDSGGIWPEDSVAKVFDSSAIIKPPVAPTRQSKKYSGSSTSETNRSVSNSNSKLDSSSKKEKEPTSKIESKPITNGTSYSFSSTTKSESSKPISSYSSVKTTDSSSSKSATSSRTGTDFEKFNSEPEPSHTRPELTQRIETNDRYDSKLEQIFPSVKPVNDLDTHLDLQNEDNTPVEFLPEGEDGPRKGIPRVIAERLKKEGNKTGHHQTSVVNNSTSQEENNIQSTMSKFENDMVLGRKRKNNTPIEDKTEPRDTTNNEILKFRNNLKSVSDSKSSKVSQVFDTSQIVRTPVNHNIPRLDLTGITDDQRNGFYQEGYKPTDIKPCTIIFIGAEIKVGRSMLDKKRSKKGKITFSDSHNQTFEYPSEEVHLEDYLASHPNEPAEILIFEDFASSTMMESSDDMDSEPLTPRDGGSNDTDETLKSNTSLSISGGLSNYRTKYQMEYTFGSAMEEPEAPKPPPPQPQEEESTQIIPADEEITWSTETNSDLLF